jgi:UDP-N-acetylglucosamine 2-epimerase (non-hydrolysing)
VYVAVGRRSAVKVLSVVGARPQFVKAFPVSAALGADHEEVLVHTGQHYDEELSDVFFEELDVPTPACNLGVGSDDHAAQTAAIMRRLDPVVADESPDVVLVYGDTNSTLGAAMVGAKRDVTVAHVEAGLRSDNRAMPEEINRVLTDHASDLLFAPTDEAVANLEREGLADRTRRTGDVMYDAIRWARDAAREATDLRETLGLVPDGYVLATIHRPRNADDPDRLAAVLDGLASAPWPVVVPVHPRTANSLDAFGLRDRTERELTLVDPVGYLEFVALLADARVVATDSGGVQKEAFFLDTPCVTLREETEWVETVAAGWNCLVGADAGAITDAIANADRPAEKPQPYGDGNAAGRIAAALSTA